MSQSQVTRREFAKAAAATVVGIAGASSPSLEAAQPESKNAQAQALYEMIRGRYGKHLDAQQLQSVHTRIEANLRSAERLRKFPVGQDDPAFVFQADI
jgi:hypothetical protein